MWRYIKKKYNIDKNLTLIILKIDYYIEGLLIPIIFYEVYHPINKSKLELNYCSNTHIDLTIPVSIKEEELYKYEPNSGYYNTTICFPATSDYKTDIIINDRINIYIDKNLNLCENDCQYKGYNDITKESICKCKVKKEMSW